MRYGVTMTGFGVAAGTFAIFFFGEVPKVRKDISAESTVDWGLFREGNSA